MALWKDINNYVWTLIVIGLKMDLTPHQRSKQLYSPHKNKSEDPWRNINVHVSETTETDKSGKNEILPDEAIWQIWFDSTASFILVDTSRGRLEVQSRTHLPPQQRFAASQRTPALAFDLLLADVAGQPVSTGCGEFTGAGPAQQAAPRSQLPEEGQAGGGAQHEVLAHDNRRHAQLKHSSGGDLRTWQPTHKHIPARLKTNEGEK